MSTKHITLYVKFAEITEKFHKNITRTTDPTLNLKRLNYSESNRGTRNSCWTTKSENQYNKKGPWRYRIQRWPSQKIEFHVVCKRIFKFYHEYIFLRRSRIFAWCSFKTLSKQRLMHCRRGKICFRKLSRNTRPVHARSSHKTFDRHVFSSTASVVLRVLGKRVVAIRR